MAITVPRAATEVDVSVGAGSSHYLDWAAIIGGAFLAAAIFSLFLTFGSAIGLSLTSFQSGSSLPPVGLVIAAGLWLLWVQVSASVGGGYLAGRMRRRIGDGTPHEAEMRDGAHGLIVWAIGIVVGAFLAAMATLVGALGAANIAGQTAANPAAVDYYVDRMLRTSASPSASSTSTGTSTSSSTATGTSTTTDTSASTTPSTGAATSTTPAVGSSSDQAAVNQQMGRVLTRSVGGATLDDSDRSYLAQQVSARTGLPQAEAEKRVDETVAAAKAQADRARRYGILLAFLTAASLLVSAVSGWWAACAGGRHRNEGIDHSQFSRWR